MATQDLIVFGLVPNLAIADRIVTDLHRAGFVNRDISILIPRNHATRDVSLAENDVASAGSQGKSSGGLGAAIGSRAEVGALVLPGFGPFLAAGPILAALGDAAVGAAVGSLSLAFIGLGIPEHEARSYEGRVKAGAGLVLVHSDDERTRETARNVLQLHLVEDVARTREVDVSDALTRSSRTLHG